MISKCCPVGWIRDDFQVHVKLFNFKSYVACWGSVKQDQSSSMVREQYHANDIEISSCILYECVIHGSNFLVYVLGEHWPAANTFNCGMCAEYLLSSHLACSIQTSVIFMVGVCYFFTHALSKTIQQISCCFFFCRWARYPFCLDEKCNPESLFTLSWLVEGLELFRLLTTCQSSYLVIT